MNTKVELYDEFAGFYDHMVSWHRRLGNEAAFFRQVFEAHGARRILDMACGTGMHAVLFAEWGYDVVGVDLSAEMIKRARQNARKSGVSVEFKPIGFGGLSQGRLSNFDVIVCLGNSLPHILTEDELARALLDIHRALNPGGTFIVQNRNYDRVWSTKERFMPLDSSDAGGKEYIFFRFLDFHADTIVFNIVTFSKEKGQWSYQVRSTHHRPLFQRDLARLLLDAGFSKLSFYGDYQQHEFDSQTSSDLVVVAR
ncbi:MAG: class I SAM-dependent methyltransferase [Chloroflexi bacterium]|nr:class I SAM-dependent methyltransferase [Chloroflexota bacterium]